MSLGTFTFDEQVLLHKVLTLLAPRSLLRVANVNKTFEHLANDDFLWKGLTAKLWSNKHIFKTQKGHICPFIKMYVTKSAYMSLKASELKWLLRQRRITSTGCWEKFEFVNLAMESSTSLLSPFTPKVPRPFRSVWKASFYMSLADGHRSFATDEDISTYKWEMYFKSGIERPLIGSFHPNGMLSYPEHQDYDGKIPWTLETRDSQQYVRVGPYPPLLVSRCPDWGWRMENVYVYFNQLQDKR